MLAIVIYRGTGDRLDETARRLLVSVENQLRISLDGLGVEDVAALAAELKAESLDDEAVQWLYNHTGGHALYLRTVLSEGFDFDPRSPGRAALPASLAAAIGDHLRVLPPGTREILEVLAVINRRMPLAQLGQAAQSGSPSAAIEPAVASGLVDWWPAEPTCHVEIRHPLVRDAIYSGITPTRRRALHARAALMVSESASWEHRVAALDRPDEDLAVELERLAKREAAAGQLAWPRPTCGGPPISRPPRRRGAAAADRGSSPDLGRRVPELAPAAGGGGGVAVPAARLRAGHDGVRGGAARRGRGAVQPGTRAGAGHPGQPAARRRHRQPAGRHLHPAG